MKRYRVTDHNGCVLETSTYQYAYDQFCEALARAVHSLPKGVNAARLHNRHDEDTGDRHTVFVRNDNGAELTVKLERIGQ